jgi:hypothetical protein
MQPTGAMGELPKRSSLKRFVIDPDPIRVSWIMRSSKQLTEETLWAWIASAVISCILVAIVFSTAGQSFRLASSSPTAVERTEALPIIKPAPLFTPGEPYY